MISIVILTKNPNKNFKKVLEAIKGQKIDQEFEIIIIDSSSTNEVLEIAKELGLNKIVKISPSEFDFHETKRLALDITQGEYIVFLSQDALPKNEFWLQNLINPFKKDERVGAVFSRQIPYPKTNLFQKYNIYFLYPEKDINKILNGVFFSNVSSAIKREILKKIEVPVKIPMSEDQIWARQILNLNYKIVYEPNSIVYHSHDYNFWDNFKRNFDSGLSLKKAKILKKIPFKHGLKYLIGEIFFLIKEKKIFFFLYLPKLVFYEFFRFFGFYLGLNYKYLPMFLRKKFSLFKKNLE
jgi:rhamnosyltransferase